MTRGRKPQQPELALAKGNPGKRKIVGLAEKKAGGSLVSPLKLTKKALAIWNELIGDLERMNFVRSTDRYAFARYCRYMVRWCELDDAVKPGAETYWTETPHGKMKRLDPAFQAMDRIDRRLEAYEVQFGLLPAARNQIMRNLSMLAPELPLALPGQPVESKRADDDAGPIGILGQIH
ncbi:phage terminase small subunit P27 family [Zavarzinia aquatilis]|uniref:Phage terminase small subunit P27 family n=1 Tax=Zavarzinia aquatilis TaxID=2211142 RepID=A0A317ED92_9PROT|nr:phage terminase small subunit P27 family [Zavarzinia aquatilis]PWR24562.1 phage terminase small subunit P27 family [Zavarzinia aquatilis]